MTSSKDEGAAIAPQNKGSWASFLKTISSFNGDLSSLTAPPFILSSTSLVEYSSYWAEQPSLFVAPASEEDPAKRALLVLKWFLTTLKHQYSSRSEKLGSEKKPLNPFLGELFIGQWEDGAGTTKLVSEQVSHHPPTTAYRIWNEEHGISLQGYNAQKASFSRTINVRQIGHALLHIDKYNEDYIITLPSLHIEGLIYGTPFIELNKSTFIQSSSGYTAKIDYSGKGWLSGKKNSFTASLYHNPAETPTTKTSDATSKHSAAADKEPIYTIEGQWTEAFTIRDPHNKKTPVVETYNFKTTAPATTALTIAPLEQQDPLESRRAWSKVASAIERGDTDTAGTEKAKIENAQREARRREAADGREWERRYFKRVDAVAAKESNVADVAESVSAFEKLASRISSGPTASAAAASAAAAGSSAAGYEKLEPEKTGGVWRWDAVKAQAAAEGKVHGSPELVGAVADAPPTK